MCKVQSEEASVRFGEGTMQVVARLPRSSIKNSDNGGSVDYLEHCTVVYLIADLPKCASQISVFYKVALTDSRDRCVCPMFLFAAIHNHIRHTTYRFCKESG